MQLGRVPVVLSDEWVPPQGPPWGDFAIRLAESRLDEIPAVLRRHEHRAQEMGAAARRAWEEWCASGPVLVRRLLDSLEELLRVRPAGDAPVQRRWRSQRWLWEQELHPAQNLAAAAREGTLLAKVRVAVGARVSRASVRRGSRGSGSRG
jgi:hypothetical protein